MRVSSEFRTKLKLYIKIATITTMTTVPTKTIMTTTAAIQTIATQMTATWTVAPAISAWEGSPIPISLYSLLNLNFSFVSVLLTSYFLFLTSYTLSEQTLCLIRAYFCLSIVLYLTFIICLYACHHIFFCFVYFFN